jgi:hypothetical protein
MALEGCRPQVKKALSHEDSAFLSIKFVVFSEWF